MALKEIAYFVGEQINNDWWASEDQGKKLLTAFWANVKDNKLINKFCNAYTTDHERRQFLCNTALKYRIFLVDYAADINTTPHYLHNIIGSQKEALTQFVTYF